MEIGTSGEKARSFVGKTLFTKDDFQFRPMILPVPGQPAREVPLNPNQAGKQSLQDTINEWHSVGSETVAVPAGTCSCEHWRSDKHNSEVWTSDKVTPFGMVRELGPNRSMVLTRILTDMTDRISGPVQKFDPQRMMRPMQQQRQQQQPKP